jgi:hypothetical protein
MPQCQYTLHCLIHYVRTIGVLKLLDTSGPGNGAETLVRMAVFRVERKNVLRFTVLLLDCQPCYN